MRRLPAGVHSNVDQEGLSSLGGGKIEIQRLIKPAGFQGLAFQIAICKAELTGQILQRRINRFDKQAVIHQIDIAFGGGQLAIQRNIKM